MDENEKTGISRRDFVQLAGAGAAAIAATGVLSPLAAQAQGTAPGIPTKWDLEADVVVIGSGAVGLPGRHQGRRRRRIGDRRRYKLRHRRTRDRRGGNAPLGGGTSAQKKYKIEDSPDVLFRDLTDWSIVEVNGMPDYRYNDRGVQRALADNEAPTYEFLVANGVEFVDQAPDNIGGHAHGALGET